MIITGSNTGIGYETAIDLVKRGMWINIDIIDVKCTLLKFYIGANVILACRNLKLANNAADSIKLQTNKQS